MYLGLNDLSLHGQVAEHDAASLLLSLLQCRKAAMDRGVALRCRREVLQRRVCGDATLRDVVFRLSPQDNHRRLLLTWLTKEGPFLDDDRLHSSDVWFECNGEIVTDGMLGELAHRSLDAPTTPTSAVSVRPSVLDHDPLTITRVESDGTRQDLALRNHTDDAALRQWLAGCEPPMRSWQALQTRALAACGSLVFAREAFAPLVPVPFQSGVADRLLERLVVLEQMKQSFGADGVLTPAGQELRQKHFVGEKAWFSDSSDSEKTAFASDLTFPHPERPGETLFCAWHGKVKTPQMRIHFSEPITALTPLYVVYVGPKITKK